MFWVKIIGLSLEALAAMLMALVALVSILQQTGLG